jgi:hypothetical protein
VDEAVKTVVAGISNEARMCLISIVGEAVSVVDNIDLFCPESIVCNRSPKPCRTGARCRRLTELLNALQGSEDRRLPEGPRPTACRPILPRYS